MQLTLQGCLNQDIDSFESERSSLSSLAEEGRSVVVMVRLGGVNTGDPMSPCSGVPPRHHGHHGGALLGQAPHGDPGPEAGLRLPGPHPRTPASLPAQVRGSQVTDWSCYHSFARCIKYADVRSVEQLLSAASPVSGLGLLPSLGSVVPLVSSAVSQLLPQLGGGASPAAAGPDPGSSCGEGRAVLRGWLSEQHTRDLVIIATNINTIKDVSRLQRLPTVRSWTSP